MRLILAAVYLTLAGCSDWVPDPEAARRDAQHAPTPDRSAMNPAQRAYAEANDRMHSAMGSNIPADADVAFVQGMIPHHQGAIDMARIVLEHGTDPENQALARAIIANQEAEIAGMRAWRCSSCWCLAWRCSRAVIGMRPVIQSSARLLSL